MLRFDEKVRGDDLCLERVDEGAAWLCCHGRWKGEKGGVCTQWIGQDYYDGNPFGPARSCANVRGSREPCPLCELSVLNVEG